MFGGQNGALNFSSWSGSSPCWWILDTYKEGEYRWSHWEESNTVERETVSGWLLIVFFSMCARVREFLNSSSIHGTLGVCVTTILADIGGSSWCHTKWSFPGKCENVCFVTTPISFVHVFVKCWECMRISHAKWPKILQQSQGIRFSVSTPPREDSYLNSELNGRDNKCIWLFGSDNNR